MVTSSSQLERIAARMTNADGRELGMATVVSPDFAVTAAHALVGSEGQITVRAEGLSRNASVISRDLSLDVAVLQLDPTKAEPPEPAWISTRVPSPGSSWVSFLHDSKGQSRYVKGRVGDRVTLEQRPFLELLEYSAEIASDGAPIVVDGELVGILNRVGRGTPPMATLFADMVTRDVGRLLGLTPTVRPTTFDATRFLDRLSVGARGVLARAEGLRIVTGEDRIHTDKLAAALVGEQDAAVASAFRAAEINWDRLSGLVVEADSDRLPAQDAFRAVPVTTLPTPSRHVRAAFVTAWDRAEERRGGQIDSLDLLAGLISVPDCKLATILRQEGVTEDLLADAARATSYPIADFWPDSVGGPDALGIEKDVRILASVLVAKDVDPPLALGLFGDWGSGKSFFMQELQAYIEELKRHARESDGKSAFCENVVQLTFNAWNYSDTDLWASLTSEIFEGLARAMEKEGEGDHPRERLLAVATSTRNVLDEAKREKALAEGELRMSQERLARVREAQPSPKAIARAAYQAVVQQPEIQKSVADAAKALGLQPDNETTARLLDASRRRGKFIRAVAAASRAVRLRVVMIAALALLLSVLIGFTIQLVAQSALVGTLVAAATALGPLVPRARKALGLLKEAQKAAAENIEAAEKQLTKNVNEASQRVVQAAQRVEDVTRQLEDLHADKQMSNFLRGRVLSEDYTRHLGVISRARRDFQELSRILAEVKEQAAMGLPATERHLPRIDRIVLYIDDLDRCPEKKVIDVIQAVHLLLAFPLFVVVVGVDARWLLHSLQQHSAAFMDDDEADDAESVHWRSTPLNYLEKIFQIPFTLRPMTKPGYWALIDRVTATKAARTAVTTRRAESRAEQPGSNGNGVGRPTRIAGGGQGNGQDAQGPFTTEESETKTATETETRRRIVPDPGFLSIGDFEREFIKKLFPLVPSPRAAKRLVNVYRLVRAGVADDKRQEFVGEDGHGSYRAVLLLLAIVAAYPEEAEDVLRELMTKPRPATWWEFVDGFERGPDQPAADGRWAELLAKLREVRDHVPDAGPCSTFADWSNEVARYSFHSARILTTPEGDDSRAGSKESSVHSDASR